ncbi:MAG: succinylglutamate desuccinylase/aspartoacylase family protein, partial [Alphaproteobacteria bacterium]|nr:succinylglutamate desuccinylase/aspartoacylase family protein [Alphaproteobacteria bacterium]
MTHRVEHISLPAMSPGSEFTLTVHKFGEPGARPKAYFQAALHADETPPLLVAHHLLGDLIKADKEGRIKGEVIVVPMANPLGLSQNLDGYHVGRHNLDGGGNFNRGFPDLGALVRDDLEGKLGVDPRTNIATIREALIYTVDNLPATTAHQALRKTLLAMAVDADIVLDLHCDLDALMHIYIGDALWPDASDLAADIGLRAVLLASDSGGGPFDETCGNVWWTLAEAFPNANIPAACLAGTVEHRGQADVSDELCKADADGLFRFLQRRRVVDGDAGDLPDLLCEGTQLSATEIVKSPVPGVVAYAVQLGDVVRKGDLIAHIIDPGADD